MKVYMCVKFRVEIRMDPLNVLAKFEIRSFSRSWDNMGYPQKLGSPCIRPRSHWQATLGDTLLCCTLYIWFKFNCSVGIFCYSERDTVQWVDWGGANQWRWIWYYPLRETSWFWNSCLQATEIFNHCRRVKVWWAYCFSVMYRKEFSDLYNNRKWTIHVYK